MVKAQKFIPEMNMPIWTPVTRVVQGAEPQLFKSKFPDWQSASMDKPTPENIMLGKGISSASNIAKEVKEDSVEQICKKCMLCTPKELKKRKERRDKDVPPIPPVAKHWTPSEKSWVAKLPAPWNGEASLKVWRVANFKKVELETELMG